MLSARIPEDKGNRIYITSFIYGIAMLAPWNGVLSTMSFFVNALPGTNIDFMISFAMNGIMIFIVILCVIFADSAAYRFVKINFILMITGILLVFVPLIV